GAGSLVVVTTFTDASATCAGGACVVVVACAESVCATAAFDAISDFTFGQRKNPPPAIAANAISKTNKTTQIGLMPCSIRAAGTSETMGGGATCGAGSGVRRVGAATGAGKGAGAGVGGGAGASVRTV